MSGQRLWGQVALRLPPDILAWVKAEAERNGASQNSEIVRAVRERMERVKAPILRNDPAEFVAEVRESMQKIMQDLKARSV